MLFFLDLLPLRSPDASGRFCSALDSLNRQGDIKRTGPEQGTRSESAWPPMLSGLYPRRPAVSKMGPQSPGWTRRRGFLSKRMSG